MTETTEPMVEFPLTNPPVRLFAYINSYPDKQVMGVVMDGRSGKVIEATILPTKQRVMLGLGVGNEQAHAHHNYRRLYPHGYRLIWTDDPGTDARLEGLKGRLERGAGELRDIGVVVKESDAARTVSPPSKPTEPLDSTGQLTTDLMRSGVEKAKAIADTSPATRASDERLRQPATEQSAADNTDTDRGGAPAVKPDLGGFF